MAHQIPGKLIGFISDAGSPWCVNSDSKTEMKNISGNCSFYEVFHKFPQRQVVGLPMASDYLETVAMDLTFYNETILLHITDHVQDYQLPLWSQKNPDTVIKTILKMWISVYGSAETLLIDHGREFANGDLIQYYKVKQQLTNHLGLMV